MICNELKACIRIMCSQFPVTHFIVAPYGPAQLVVVLTCIKQSGKNRGYKTAFILVSAEHEIFPVHEC